MPAWTRGDAATMATFQFPTVEAQLSDKWLGGGAQTFMKGVADVFKEQGNIDVALDTYENAVNTGPLQAAADVSQTNPRVAGLRSGRPSGGSL
jgi:ABC-type taurine transport system substrate-binding protein